MLEIKLLDNKQDFELEAGGRLSIIAFLSGWRHRGDKKSYRFMYSIIRGGGL